MHSIYFDNAASTPVAPEVIQTLTTALGELHGNPSSLHALGRRSKAALEEAREAVAQTLGCRSDEITFTSGGTEADNLVLRSAVQQMDIRHIITSELEHKAVLQTVEDLPVDRISYVKFDAQGVLDQEDLEGLLSESDEKTLVSLMHGNNEIGNLNDIREIGARCAAHRALFHSDTVQTLGKYPLDLRDLPVDFASFSAHKIYGPKGVGFAYIRAGLPVLPLLTGGGQEQNRRSGTEALCSILGMAKAVTLTAERSPLDAQRLADLKAYCLNRLAEAIPEIQLNGRCGEQDSLYNLISLRLPGIYPLIHFQLDLSGIAVSAGSACAAGTAEPSHVMQALDISDTSIRISFNRYNTCEEVDFFIEKLAELLKAASSKSA